MSYTVRIGPHGICRIPSPLLAHFWRIRLFSCPRYMSYTVTVYVVYLRSIIPRTHKPHVSMSICINYPNEYGHRASSSLPPSQWPPAPGRLLHTWLSSRSPQRLAWHYMAVQSCHCSCRYVVLSNASRKFLQVRSIPATAPLLMCDAQSRRAAGRRDGALLFWGISVYTFACFTSLVGVAPLLRPAFFFLPLNFSFKTSRSSAELITILAMTKVSRSLRSKTIFVPTL